MIQGLLVFEDDRWGDLGPIADVTPVPQLRFGGDTLARRWAERSGAKSLVRVVQRAPERAALEPSRVDPDEVGPDELLLLVNAAALPGPWLEDVARATAPVRLTCGDRLVGARMTARDVDRALDMAGGFDALAKSLPKERREVGAAFLDWPWDFVARNAEALAEDLGRLPAGVHGEVDPRAVLLGPERIKVDPEARVDALAVLDARGGPIRIRNRAVVLPHTVVVGPCDVGEGTQLLGGFVGRSSIGPECRIAGEVEECIVQGYVNKRHHGFVGHSVIGEWANLGALTTTSDLKNNYGTVRVWAAGGMRETGSMKIGAFVGAHAKTGIGTLLPTGGSIGVGANLFGGGRFAPKRVPAFAWWDGERFEEHRLDAMLDTARTAASRRGRELTKAETRRLEALFDATAKDRAEARRGSERRPAGARRRATTPAKRGRPMQRRRTRP